jgi:hypothetical protein
MSLLVTIHRIPLKELAIEEKKREFASIVSGKSTYKYDKVPSKYTKDQWPTRTNLHCASCFFCSTRMPFFIPVGKDGNHFVRGANPVYCSPACAMYVVLRIDDQFTRDTKAKLVSDLVFEMTGVKGIIVPSANPYTLEKLGGTVSDRDFQNNIYTLNSIVIEKMYANRVDMIDELS